MIEGRENKGLMLSATHDILWRKVKQLFNENPQGILRENIMEKIPIKPIYIKDNPHAIITDYIEILKSARFLSVIVHDKVIYKPLWKIPKHITLKEVTQLINNPHWMLWFMYPGGIIV